MIAPPKEVKPPKIARENVHSWNNGYQSHTDITRSQKAALATADNVLVVQDGAVRPRPSTALWGEQPVGKVLGLDEFVKLDVNNKPETMLASVQIDPNDSNAKLYVNKDGGSWTECSGKTYNDGVKANFVQGAGKLLVLNGEDNLSYLNFSDMTIKTFSPLATPVISTATPTGLTGSSLTYRYRVSALNEVGESIASTAATVTVGTDRDAWDPATQYVTVSWGAITGATGYAIYLGISAGRETMITTVPDTSTSYKDTGVAPQIVSRLAPSGNSTEGPICSTGANVGGQIFMTGDKENPYRVWYGGTGQDALDFSPFNGGGWIDVSLGGKDLPVRIVPFRDGKGTPMATIMMKGTNGSGKIVHLGVETQSLADVIISFMAAYEANGQDGTDSPNGVVVYRDSMWYPSADGFKTTGTRPNIQNILSTNNITDTITDDIAKLNRNAMSTCSGIAYDGRIYWAVPIGGGSNSQIWVLDIARGGQWMLPWYLNADQLLLYGDSQGKTHFLMLSDDKIYEFTRTKASEDNGVKFRSKISSGYVKVDENGMDWMHVIDVTFVFINPQGDISMRVRGKTEDEPVAPVGDRSFTPTTSYAGWGELKTVEGIPVTYLGWGDKQWGEIVNAPASYGASRVARTIEVDEVVNYLQWEVEGFGADYILSDVVVRYINVGTIITDEMEM